MTAWDVRFLPLGIFLTVSLAAPVTQAADDESKAEHSWLPFKARYVAAPSYDLMPSPPLEEVRKPATHRGELISIDVRTREVRTLASVDLEGAPPSDWVPPSSYEDLPPDVLNKVFSAWSQVNDPTIGDYPRHVKLFISFTDINANPGTGACSGTLIDPMHVLTAGHCAFIFQIPNGGPIVNNWADSIMVVPGRQNGASPWNAAFSASLHSWTGWTQERDWSHDIAVIELDRPIGSLVGWQGFGYNTDCGFYESTQWRHRGYPASPPFTGEVMFENVGEFDTCFPLFNNVSFDQNSSGGTSGTGATKWGIVYTVLSNGTASETNDARLTSGKFNDIHFWLDAREPNAPDLWPLFTVLSESGQTVNAGSTLNSIGFRVFNYSSTTFSGPVPYYVRMSTDNVITTSDTIVASGILVLDLGPRETHIELVGGATIPADTPPGQYFFGVTIPIADADQSNNATGPQDVDLLTVQCPTPSAPALSLPADGATCQPISATVCTWTPVADAVGYRLQYGTTCFSGPEIDVGNQTQIGLDNLAEAETYHWRVKTLNACGNWGFYTPCREFTTETVAGLASFYGPPDGDQCQNPIAVTIDWADVPGAIGYAIKLTSTCNEPGLGVYHEWSDHTFTMLQANTTYFYQVRARNVCGNFGPWTACRSFKTKPSSLPEPTSFTPSDGDACVPPKPTLIWSYVPEASSYELQIGSSCGTGTVYTSTTNFHTTTTLPEQIHHWRVRSADGCGNLGPWSPCQQFTVDATPPTQPVLLESTTHAEGEWSDDNQPFMQWDAAVDVDCGIVEYALRWDDTPIPLPLPWQLTSTSAFYATLPLPDGPDQYFHMYARDAAGNYVQSYLTAGPYHIDTTAPSNPNITESIPSMVWTNAPQVTLQWPGASDETSGVAGYYVTFDKNSTTVPPPSTLTQATSGTYVFPTDGSYYFHLRTVDTAGNVSATQTRGPYLVDLTPPWAQIEAPESFSQITHNTYVIVEWTMDDEGSGVDTIELSYAPSIGDDWYSIVRGSAQQLGGTYQWQVPFISTRQAWLRIDVTDRAGTTSTYQQQDPVQVLVVTDVEELPSAALRELVLRGNHPNPFNPQTSIRYGIPLTGRVRIEIHDAAGRLVRKLLDEAQPGPAWYDRVWDGRNDAGQPVASGVYFYRVLTAGETRVDRMTLVR